MYMYHNVRLDAKLYDDDDDDGDNNGDEYDKMIITKMMLVIGGRVHDHTRDSIRVIYKSFKSFKPDNVNAIYFIQYQNVHFQWNCELRLPAMCSKGGILK